MTSLTLVLLSAILAGVCYSGNVSVWIDCVALSASATASGNEAYISVSQLNPNGDDIKDVKPDVEITESATDVSLFYIVANKPLIR